MARQLVTLVIDYDEDEWTSPPGEWNWAEVAECGGYDYRVDIRTAGCQPPTRLDFDDRDT